jgi:hypothetical protein
MTLANGRKRPDKPEPRFKWLLPLFIVVAVVVLVGAIIWGIVARVPFF